MLSNIIRGSWALHASSLNTISIRAYATKPPTYFANHLSKVDSKREFAPSPQNLFSPTRVSSLDRSSSDKSQSGNEGQSGSHGSSRLAAIRDLSVVLSIITLTFFAIENYRKRTLLEQRAEQNNITHMKRLATIQNTFNAQRKKKEIMVLNERKTTQKREMKMVYHIAMLRKQLIDAGLQPVEIEDAIAEFEKNVKMETAISNVSGTALWVVDESPMKAYVPNAHDYESKKT